MTDEIAVTDSAGVRLLELNRPDSLNALTDTMRRSIEECVREFDADDSLKALVLTGRGRGFCSGADLATAQPVEKLSRRHLKQPRFWWHLPFDTTEKPTICALNGVAAGGGLGLALSCDIILAGASAKMHPAFLKVALSPDNGVAQQIVRRIGYSRSLLFFLRGEPFTADQAAAIGLVDEVVPDDQLRGSAMALAATVATGPSVAIELTKRMLKSAIELDRKTALALEEISINLSRGTLDAAEGVAAFRERRAPVWRGE